MSFAPQSIVSAQRRRSKRAPISPSPTQAKTTVSPLQKNLPSPNGNRQVQRLPNAKIAPVWLRSLLLLKHSSCFFAFFVVSMTVAVYGWTVHVQKQWSQEYRKLETLQRNERHFKATNEVMKNQFAQESDRSVNGLVPLEPANVIFLPTAPQRQFKSKPKIAPKPEPSTNMPLGY